MFLRARLVFFYRWGPNLTLVCKIGGTPSWKRDNGDNTLLSMAIVNTRSWKGLMELPSCQWQWFCNEMNGCNFVGTPISYWVGCYYILGMFFPYILKLWFMRIGIGWLIGSYYDFLGFLWDKNCWLNPKSINLYINVFFMNHHRSQPLMKKNWIKKWWKILQWKNVRKLWWMYMQG